MFYKKLLFTAAMLIVVPLASCSSTSTSSGLHGPQVADLSFTQLQPLQLNVGAVDVIDNTVSVSAKAPDMRVSPSNALGRYARKRLQAMGGEGTLKFVIQQASLTSAQSEPNQNKWAQAFALDQSMDYTITMRVGLDLTGRTTQPNIKSAYTLERKKTLPAGTSLADRDRELNLLIADMVKNVDMAVEKGIEENMRIIVRPGAITFGKPAPIEAITNTPIPQN
jgi:hypothetical protein